MTEWIPVSCTLSLNFTGGNSKSNAPLAKGDVYKGTSVIRYRRTVICDSMETASTFDQLRRVVQNNDGLHFYAHTRTNASFSKGSPLTIGNYKISVVGDSSKSFKIASIVEMDDLAGEGKSEPTAEKKAEGKQKKSGANTKKGGAKADTVKEEICGDVFGSKIIVLEKGNHPEGEELDLSIHFAGVVQDWDVGGIYTPNQTSGTQVLQTHFEVHLARLAFPCPDHPNYRLFWQFKLLQLPLIYRTVFSNGDEVNQKEQADQGVVQYSYAPVGPLPAYLLSFAALTCDFSELLVCEDTVALKSLSFFTEELSGEESNPVTEMTLRVVALPGRSIELSTVERVCHVAKEVIHYLETFFKCPFPSLLITKLDICLLPTMPYLSGMENHGCIFLNESIFVTKAGGKGNNDAVVVQNELVIHEIIHHWSGNALGLPFSIKEGICLLLEELFGDVVMGKPMRKVKFQNSAENFEQVETGREFTGHTYQHALLTLKNIYSELGHEIFERKMQELFRAKLVSWMKKVEENGGLELYLMGAGGCSENVDAPFVNAEEFLSFLK